MQSQKKTLIQLWKLNGVEVLLPFLLAGIGMVLAGILLDHVQHWNVFKSCPQLFILVPALLGLKGNLEMTLASRLSTASNLGILDDFQDAQDISIGNLALIQIQGIVVGGLASIFAMIFDFDLKKALLLSTSSIITASLASFSLGIVMIGVILASRRLEINPDNVATPIAASLGDLVTLAILAFTSKNIHYFDSILISLAILSLYFALILPYCLQIAKKCNHTKDLLKNGWTPVLSAMVISSLGGTILNKTILTFPKIASFQPVINGVAGNLVGVQASRLSTQLHQKRVEDDYEGLLLSLVIPGHLFFNLVLAFFKGNKIDLSKDLTAVFVTI